jgi:hypothetical protein
MPADMLAVSAGVLPYLVTAVAMGIGYLYFCSGRSKVRPLSFPFLMCWFHQVHTRIGILYVQPTDGAPYYLRDECARFRRVFHSTAIYMQGLLTEWVGKRPFTRLRARSETG